MMAGSSFMAWRGGSSVSETATVLTHVGIASHPFDPGVPEQPAVRPNCYRYICGISDSPPLPAVVALHCTCTEDEAMSVDYRDVW
jgi:hypothetical protein